MGIVFRANDWQDAAVEERQPTGEPSGRIGRGGKQGSGATFRRR